MQSTRLATGLSAVLLATLTTWPASSNAEVGPHEAGLPLETSASGPGSGELQFADDLQYVQDAISAAEQSISPLNAPELNVSTDFSMPIVVSNVREDSGFGSISADLATRRIVLRWRGEVPDVVRDTVTSVSASGTQVDVLSTDRSMLELDAIANALLERFRATPVLREAVAGVSFSEDLTTYRIYLRSPDARNGTQIESVARGLVPVDLDISLLYRDWAASTEPVEAGTRWDDQPPFNGAAFIERPTGLFGYKQCTSAFGVRNAAGTTRGMVTAKHCGTSANWYTPEGQHIGFANNYADNTDVMLILWNTSQQGYPGFSGKNYFGTYQSGTQGVITGSGTPAVGETQCLSGAQSGNTCDNSVIEANWYHSEYGGPMHITMRETAGAAAGNGDSGGANYTLGTRRRTAKGVISLQSTAEQHQYPCNGAPTNPGFRECSRVIFSATLTPVLNATGLQVINGTNP